ncbi:MAG: hypothetical protein QOE52_4132 [Mycobacterium sp.]|jgi:hypothetical protein|nr:hypothetical protein [Mycobacterium sp.]MDT7769252.1 hypothetical protein [Mycobacterium sp.]
MTYGIRRLRLLSVEAQIPKAVQTMLGHQSAALTLDTYADLFPDDLELVSAALDQARQAALNATADQLRTGAQQNL